MGDTDTDRIRKKAHELWEAEGRPHGRDEDHWIQAREIIAIQDSQRDTLLPADTGADEPIENADEALRNLADFPNLTDQGENLLTSTDREPEWTTSDPKHGGSMPSVAVPTSDQPGIAPTKGGYGSAKAPVPAKAKSKSSDPSKSEPVKSGKADKGSTKAAKKR